MTHELCDWTVPDPCVIMIRHPTWCELFKESIIMGVYRLYELFKKTRMMGVYEVDELFKKKP